MTRHSLSPLIVLALAAAAALTGCSPTPAPTPSPTPAFATEDEAFAAAEKTYRAYIDALNSVDAGDPATFEPLYELSRGSFEAADRKNFSRMHARNRELRETPRFCGSLGNVSRRKP